MSTSLRYMRLSLLLFILFTSSQLWAQYNIGYKERGNAAYYSDKLHGRPTASGEIYDKNAYTTAHKTIPFGTIVKITNLDNDKSINLKVNDRGPFHPDKMVDVSRAAAEYLDMIEKGVVPVELEILGEDAIVLPGQNVATQQNNTIDFNAPAVALDNQNQQTQSNTQVANSVPETKPYIPPKQKKTRSIPKTLPATTSSKNNLKAKPASIEIEQVGFVQRGKATYYGANRNGKITVTGEEFNSTQLVAAHPNIQLNSLVKVTNLDNGNEVMLRINDRPTASEMEQQTIIVVSEKAATTLGILEEGSTDVKLEIINSGTQSEDNPISNALNIGLSQVNAEETLSFEERETNRLEAIASMIQPVNTYNTKGETQYPKGYGVQVASYNNQQSALEKAVEFEALQFRDVMIQAGWSNGERSYRVLIGEFKEQEAADQLIDFLKNTEIKPFARKHLQVEKQ